MKKILIICLMTASAALIIFYFKYGEILLQSKPAVESVPDLFYPETAKRDRINKVDIVDGSTYGSLMEEAGVNYGISEAIFEAAQDAYDLVKIRTGRTLDLIYYGETDELKELIYQIDSEERLHVQKVCFTGRAEQAEPDGDKIDEVDSGNMTDRSACWKASIIPIDYEIKIRTAEGIVESSMYQAATEADIDIRAIIELADAFQWTIDFAIDPRVGDGFKFVYEERYLEGEYVMPGRVLAGKYVNNGEPYTLYYFEESEDNQGYFDQDGNSVQKMFLKAPVAYRYISSGYTTGKRYIPAFRMFTSSHMAIDYAAAAGTPVRAVGDGTVTYAGWKTSYGNTVSLRHNGTYSTNYCHLSGFAVRSGVKVKQGDVIGYVGSTGLSTGPHLHYEMIKHGVKVSPLLEILPPGEPIKQENRDRFFEEIREYREIFEN